MRCYSATDSQVDQGTNPDRWLKSFVERAAHENMYTNGILSNVNVCISTSLPLPSRGDSNIYTNLEEIRSTLSFFFFINSNIDLSSEPNWRITFLTCTTTSTIIQQVQCRRSRSTTTTTTHNPIPQSHSTATTCPSSPCGSAVIRLTSSSLP